MIITCILMAIVSWYSRRERISKLLCQLVPLLSIILFIGLSAYALITI